MPPERGRVVRTRSLECLSRALQNVSMRRSGEGRSNLWFDPDSDEMTRSQCAGAREGRPNAVRQP